MANTARWAAQQRVQQETQRAGQMEKRLWDLEKQLRDAKAAAATAAAAAAAAEARAPSPSGPAEGMLIPGLTTPITPATPIDGGGALAAVQRARGTDSSSSRPRPKPPAYPRPSSLPDYRGAFAIAPRPSANLPSGSSRRDHGSGGGRGGSSLGSASTGALGAWPQSRRVPPKPSVVASTLQNVSSASGLLGRMSRLFGSLGGGAGRSARQREIEAARERRSASRRKGRPLDGGSLDNLSGLVRGVDGDGDDSDGDNY